MNYFHVFLSSAIIVIIAMLIWVRVSAVRSSQGMRMELISEFIENHCFSHQGLMCELCEIHMPHFYVAYYSVVTNWNEKDFKSFMLYITIYKLMHIPLILSTVLWHIQNVGSEIIFFQGSARLSATQNN